MPVWHVVLGHGRGAPLSGLALLALACAVVLWAPVGGGAPETRPFEGQPPNTAQPTTAAWLEPVAAPLPLIGAGTEPVAPLSPTRKEAVRDAYGSLPLSFVENAGQLDRRVRYYVQGQGFGFYFTPDKAVLSFAKGRRGTALHLTPLGTSPNARLVATRRGQGRVNYLVGSEQHTNLATYHELTYRDLWPGIDMVFRGRGGKLKYEFRVAPRADPAQISLAYRGADALLLGRSGDLLVKTPLGTLRDSRPRSYKQLGSRRVAVQSRYLLEEGGSSYGFALGASHDPSRPLVIDPALTYSTFLGGASGENGDGIAVDTDANVYVTGSTSEDFPTTVGAFDTSFNGSAASGGDAFVTKLNASGTALVYSTYLGGASGSDVGTGITVDARGNAYVTGAAGSSDFPTTAGAFDTSFNGSTDGFVTKLNAAGSALVYSTYLGGASASEFGSGIAIDGSGSAYITGPTDSSDFPTTAGAFERSFGGLGDAFVTKLNAAGSALAYSTYLGGGSFDQGNGIALDASGSAYVTGATDSPFPTTVGAFDTSANGGGPDAFVTKLNATGSALVYSTYLGGSSFDGSSFERGDGIAVDRSGSAYVTGSTDTSNFPTTAGAFDTSLNGSADAFVTKLTAAGSALSYSSYIGGAGFEESNGIAVDAGGSAYVTGRTPSSNFPTTEGAFDRSFNGSRTLGGGDAFVSRLNAAGTALAYSTYLGGSDQELGLGVAVDATGSAYVTGSTFSSDFPTTAGAFDTSFALQDAFVTKLNLNQCSDGRDNDSDGRIDFPVDPGCSSASDDDERDDAPSLPTSKEQCKNGGWRNFPGFKNQGECVAFVERGPKP